MGFSQFIFTIVPIQLFHTVSMQKSAQLSPLWAFSTLK